MWLLLGILLLSIGTNLDDLGVGLAYGASGLRLPAAANLVIAAIATLTTGAAIALGHAASHLVAVRVANILGGLVLIAVGLVIGMKGLLDGNHPAGPQPFEIKRFRVPFLGLAVRVLREPARADQNNSGSIDVGESIPLGLALAANNVAGGVGGGLAGFPPLTTALVVGLGSYLTLWGGWHAGQRAARPALGARAALLAAVILILVGLREI